MQNLVKFNLKFVPILLALFVSYLIFSVFYFENSLISNEESNIKLIPDDHFKSCNNGSFSRVADVVLKCSLAFLFGVWVSDGKFIFFGAI